MGTSRMTTLIGDIDTELFQLGDCRKRALRAQEMIAQCQAAEKEIRKKRNRAIRSLCEQYGPAKTARMLGMKPPTVKGINQRT